jgi:cell division protein FtsB
VFPGSPRRRRQLRTAHETSQQRRRVLTYALLLVSAALMVNALIGENGYLASVRAQREYDEVMASLTRLRNENQALREETSRLRDDRQALEEAARRDLGLIRPGETVVIVRDAEKP